MNTVTTAAELDASIRTLMPGLRLRNYVERWAEGSPAVQALRILADAIQDAPVVAGEHMDPDVPSYHRRPPEAEPPRTEAAIKAEALREAAGELPGEITLAEMGYGGSEHWLIVRADRIGAQQ